MHKCKPTMKWKESFESYLQTMPNYYAGVMMSLLFLFLLLHCQHRLDYMLWKCRYENSSFSF